MGTFRVITRLHVPVPITCRPSRQPVPALVRRGAIALMRCSVMLRPQAATTCSWSCAAVVAPLSDTTAAARRFRFTVPS